jgi:hypothetical protein
MFLLKRHFSPAFLHPRYFRRLLTSPALKSDQSSQAQALPSSPNTQQTFHESYDTSEEPLLSVEQGYGYYPSAVMVRLSRLGKYEIVRKVFDINFRRLSP